jgi:hypothetical protein
MKPHYTERRFPRTITEAFGPNYTWESDYYKSYDRANGAWWWVLAGVLLAVLVVVVFSQF